MPPYFFLLEAAWFHKELKPALAACWRQRSFQPCQALCAQQAGAARRFAETYHVPLEGSTIFAVAEGLPFDRNLWRCLAGELLLYGAKQIPEIQAAPETLSLLLAPGFPPTPSGAREGFAPIQQVHFGSRDVVFGGGYYRPEQAGLNDVTDVRRLGDYLGSVNPDAWRTADLAPIPELADEEERAAELEFVRDSFPALRQLYERARERNQVVICEIQ
jgi:hypothetical protein